MTVGIAAAAVLGWLANYVLHRIVTRSGEVARRVDDLCGQILELTDLSTDYWLSTDRSSSALEPLEARILGKQHWVQGAIDILAEDIWYLRWSIDDNIMDFMDALTGASFGEKDGAPNFENGVKIQSVASELVFEIRRNVRSWRAAWF